MPQASYSLFGLPGQTQIPYSSQAGSSWSVGPWQVNQAGTESRSESSSSQYQQAPDEVAIAQAYKQSRFNEIWPWLQGFLGGFHGLGPFTAGGASGQGPEISVGPIWNAQQQNQQIQAMKSGINQQTGNQQRLMQQSLAGRGFGGGGPLSQALSTQMQNQALGQQVGGERDIRLQTAMQNAGQIFKTQQAREQQFATRQAEDIERRKPYFALAGSLLGGLGGLV